MSHIPDNNRKINPEDAVCLMYSGGLDSTLLAAILSKKFKRMCLVTYDLPYTVGMSNALKNLEKLKTVNPDCSVTHEIVNLTKTRQLFFDEFYNDYFIYCNDGAPGIICFACRIAMVLESIRICLQQNIGYLAIGNTSIQANKAHSFPCNVKRFADLMAEYNITYTNDIFGIESREKENLLLRAFGLDVGRNIGLSSVTNQPRCLLGVYSTLWLMGNPLSEKDMGRYFDDKLSLMRDYLSEYAHLKESIQTKKEFETKVDENISGGWTHEFGPMIDVMLSKILSPMWKLSKRYFRYKRELLRNN